jgi:hypothetical protein
VSNSPFKTKDFKALQKKWEERLKKEGFEDIERKEGRLKSGSVENVRYLYTTEQFNIKEEYYRLAGQFLHEYKFKSSVERKIWELHSEGMSVRNIIKKLKHKGITAYKNLVHGTIVELADKMKTHARKR